MSSPNGTQLERSLHAPAWLCRIQTPNTSQHARSGWKIALLASVGLPLIVFGMLMLIMQRQPMRPDLIVTMMIGIVVSVVVVPGLIMLLSMFFRRRSFWRSLPPPAPGDSYEAIAHRAWAHEYRRLRKGKIAIDQWFTAIQERKAIAPGDPQPIVITDAGISIPDLADASKSIHEQVDVGAARAITKHEFRTRFMPFVIALPFLIVVVVLSRGHTPFVFYFQIAFMLLPAWILLQRRGHVPAALGVAIAEPGSVRVPRLGNEVIFTPQDSILVLSLNTMKHIKSSAGKYDGAGVPITAVLQRSDGERKWMAYSDCRDPGLADLLARWTAGYPASSKA